MSQVNYQSTDPNYIIFRDQQEIWKKQQIEKISIEADEQRAMKLADVASRRELQKLDLSITTDGRVQVVKQMFGGGCSDKTNFFIKEFSFLTSLEDEDVKVLYLLFELSGGRKKSYVSGKWI